jgi:lipopolysaccharide transport system permease protein
MGDFASKKEQSAHSASLTAREEIFASLRAWEALLFLSLHDIRAKYRRTMLGPWWVVLGVGISLGLMSALWSIIFGLDWREYLNYMIAGIITWYWIQGYITQSCEVFTAEFSSLLRSLPTPPIMYVYRFVMKGAWMFAHYLPIWLISAIITSKYPSIASIILFPIGFLFIIVNAIAITIILGMGNARFRDLSPAVTALMTPMLLLTPVIWQPSMLGDYQIIATLNPFTHFVSIIRGPLIGNVPSALTWSYVSAVTVFNVAVAAVLYGKFRKHIVFWI